MSNEWTKIEPEMTPIWNSKDENDNFNLKDGDEIEGVYKEKKENIGPNDSTIYTIKTEKGDIGVWGSTILDVRLNNIEEGQMVKIVYKGLAESEKNKGRKYRDYDVYKKQVQYDDVPVDDDIPVVEEDDIDTKDIF